MDSGNELVAVVAISLLPHHLFSVALHGVEGIGDALAGRFDGGVVAVFYIERVAENQRPRGERQW